MCRIQTARQVASEILHDEAATRRLEDTDELLIDRACVEVYHEKAHGVQRVRRPLEESPSPISRNRPSAISRNRP